MRPEIRWGLASVAAFSIGMLCAVPYARFAAPYYAVVDRLIATGYPWDVISVDVRAGKSELSAELQLWAFVRRHRDDQNPAAKVVARVQVGEVVETPILFWTLLLVWPVASPEVRLKRVAIGAPVFLGLEAITTATQLIVPMAQASAILAGDNDPLTAWDRWSRFLEADGQFALICAGVLAVVTWTRPFFSADTIPPSPPPS